MNERDPQYTDTYIVKSLTDGVMTYYHTRMKVTFTSQKVSCFCGDA